MFKVCGSSSLISSTTNQSLDSLADEETEPWHGLIHKMSVFHLDNLHVAFKEKKYKEPQTRKIQPDPGLTKEEFIHAVDEIFGSCKYSLQATLLFAQIDKEDAQRITWDQFLDFIIRDAEARLEPSLRLELEEIFSPPHVKRETIAKIVLVETRKYFCYAVVSKHGRVGLYGGNMDFLTSYHVIMAREDVHRSDAERRRRNRWITDAVFMEDVQMFAVASSARSITIYDASGLKHVPLWLITGIPNAIQCFCYSFGDTKTLFMGDDHGQIVSLVFLQPKDGLLRRKHNDQLTSFYWVELPNEKEYVLIKSYGKLHADNVRAIQFFADNATLVSCSRDVSVSVLIKHSENKRKPYVFRMKRGTTCFCVSRFLKILVTGSDDGIVRVWNVVLTSKPSAILKGHQSGVIDVQIFELQDLFLSCSRDGILKVWSLKDQKCIQTLSIKFPSFQILGKTIEWGTRAIYPGPKRYPEVFQYGEGQKQEFMIQSDNLWERSHVFITCCNYMARVKLVFKDSFRNFEAPVLPPPPLQTSVLIPTTWKISEDVAEAPSFRSVDLDEEQIQEHLQSLKFILDKDLLAEFNLKNDINTKIARLESAKMKMRNMVSQGAPFLALDLQKPEEIKLNPDLPVPNSKRIKNLVEKTHRMLSAESAKSRILSEASSSSKTLSSRSSVISFD